MPLSVSLTMIATHSPRGSTISPTMPGIGKYAIFEQDPRHPSLQLKPVGGFWSVRVNAAYRALAVREGNVFTWFWIGSHDDYERLINA